MVNLAEFHQKIIVANNSSTFAVSYIGERKYIIIVVMFVKDTN